MRGRRGRVWRCCWLQLAGKAPRHQEEAEALDAFPPCGSITSGRQGHEGFCSFYSSGMNAPVSDTNRGLGARSRVTSPLPRVDQLKCIPASQPDRDPWGEVWSNPAGRNLVSWGLLVAGSGQPAHTTILLGSGSW